MMLKRRGISTITEAPSIILSEHPPWVGLRTSDPYLCFAGIIAEPANAPNRWAAARSMRWAPKCTFYTTVATLTRTGHAGANKLAFTGRVRGRALKPGRYRAVFAATDASGTSQPQSVSFRVVGR
jgi:hypothetical protein